MEDENVLAYFVPILFSSPTRVIACVIAGLSAGPVGLMVSICLLCGILMTSLFLPFWIVPLCSSVYVAFLAFVVWKCVCLSIQFGKSLRTSFDKTFRSLMMWFYSNVEIFPLLSYSGLSLSEPSHSKVYRQSELGENEEDVFLEDRRSDYDHGEAAKGEVRQLNVRSVGSIY